MMPRSLIQYYGCVKGRLTENQGTLYYEEHETRRPAQAASRHVEYLLQQWMRSYSIILIVKFFLHFKYMLQDLNTNVLSSATCMVQPVIISCSPPAPEWLQLTYGHLHSPPLAPDFVCRCLNYRGRDWTSVIRVEILVEEMLHSRFFKGFIYPKPLLTLLSVLLLEWICSEQECKWRRCRFGGGVLEVAMMCVGGVSVQVSVSVSTTVNAPPHCRRAEYPAISLGSISNHLTPIRNSTTASHHNQSN